MLKGLRGSARVLLLAAEGPESDRVDALLRALGESEVRREVDLPSARRHVQEQDVEAVVLLLPLAETGPRELLSHLSAPRPGLAVLVLARASDAALAVEARAAGAVDDLALEDLDAAQLERALRLAVTTTRLAVTRERFDTVTTGAWDVLWHWDLRRDRLHFTPRWAAILGLEPRDVPSSSESWFERVHADDLPRLRAAIAAHLAGETEACEVDYRLRREDGAWRRIACRAVARHDDAGATVLAGSQADVTELEELEGGAPPREPRDPITGLPDRALFLERLRLAIARSGVRAGFAVLVLDLHRFQHVNDSLGLDAGDVLLRHVTGRLVRCLRAGDTLTRLGSDKFAFLIEPLERVEDAVRVAEKAHALLERPFEIEGEEVHVAAGIGIALGAPTYRRPEDVMRDAYTAMHRAKLRAGAHHEVFDPRMNAGSIERLRLENDLRRAVSNDELVLHYQPIVRLQPDRPGTSRGAAADVTGRIVGFEALVRWIHPERGLVPPGRFVPLAEETGLIEPIGRWVLDEACRTLRGWRHRHGSGPLSLAVNLSSRQFADPCLADEVAATIDEHGVEPTDLRLEITESVLMESSADNEAQLRDLRGLGCELAIDDFGTGYSSLGALQRLPVGALKIDRSFVRRMDGDDAKLVSTIVTLADNLDMDVVAEGVETREQLARLRGLGCAMGQGFLFSGAVDAEAAEALFASGARW